jgi:starch-binding outer membrane protein, SusD/RagB family
MKIIKNKFFANLALFASIISVSQCKSFIEVDPPLTSTNAGVVYQSDVTAAGVMTGLYTNLSAEENGNITGLTATSILPSASADELTVFSDVTAIDLLAYYQNNLRADIVGENDFWQRIYKFVFVVNSVIEGVEGSTTLTTAVKSQLLGEAHFVRAFCYFHLVNLYGEVPLITNIDYKLNSTKPKTAIGTIYDQIKADLLIAQEKLNADYMDGSVAKPTDRRVRPNKAAASAMLARVFLYSEDWQNAELQASAVINDSKYEILPLNDVFLANSRETIWALQSTGVGTDANTGAGKIYVIPSTGPDALHPYYLSDDLLESFEPGDDRFTNWVNRVTSQGITYQYPFKYKVGAEDAPNSEYPVVLRLAEQYLIRAEARAMQGNLTGSNSAKSDIDVIRERAGLTGTPAASQSDLLTAVLAERRHELFTEWGHRWFDLKRTKTVDAVMVPATAKKGGTWSSTDALYPFSLHEIRNNPNLVQNEGY